MCYNQLAMKKSGSSTTGQKVITQNRKARYDYHLMDRYEAGVALTGTEVKSIRSGHMNLADSYARVDEGEIFLVDAYVSPYEYGTHDNHEPKRKRKLLMHRKEIRRLASKTNADGITLIPTRAYFSRGKVKIEIALARGKHDYDKREDLKKQTDRRTIQRYLHH